MRTDNLSRDAIITALRNTLEPLDSVHAMWEGGAAAFDRVDDWSDIDLQIDVADDQVDAILALVEKTLLELSQIDLKYEVPRPTWHGHAQTFFRLERASPFLLVDLAVIQHSNPNKFLEAEIHGHACVHFDKAGVTAPPAFDRDALAARLQARLPTLRTLFDLYQILTIKELNRGNDIEAISFYNGFTLRPLVEALRIRYAPARHNFHTRYVHYEFPPEVVERLRGLFFVRDAADLRAKQQAAEAWFHTELGFLEDHVKVE